MKKRHTCWSCKRKRNEDKMALLFSSKILPLSFDIWCCKISCSQTAIKLIGDNTFAHYKIEFKNVQRS